MSLLRKWIEGLRSGRYKQVQNLLRTEKGYCADGVLCDVSELGKWQENYGTTFWYKIRDYQTSVVFPLILYAILKQENCVVQIPIELLTPQQKERLTWRHRAGKGINTFTLNDAGFSFAEIADLLEKANPEIVSQEE